MMSSTGTPLRVGIHRTIPVEWQGWIPPTRLVWESGADGSAVATFSISSPGAAAVRLAARYRHLPDGAQVRFYSPESAGWPFGPYGASELVSDSRKEPIWSPVFPGGTIVVEIFVPRAEQSKEVEFSLERVAHVVHSPFDPGFAKGYGQGAMAKGYVELLLREVAFRAHEESNVVRVGDLSERDRLEVLGGHEQSGGLYL